MDEPSLTRPLTGPPPKSLRLPGARLVVLRGPDKGRARRIDVEEVIVGKAQGCDMQLTDATVSRHHLSVRALDDGYLVTDLESTNGTRIAGRRTRATYVEPGDCIDLGATRVRFESSGPAVELPLSEARRFGSLIGNSVAARRLFSLLEAVAAETATVLLAGETGTGKDAVAEAIHEAGPRRERPFVVVDCSALADGLVESELFGHEKGAFTGADRARTGAIVEADQGTLFIDEVGELPKELQSKLLRVLEKREVRPLGGNRTVAVDIRVIAATNRDLRVDINRGLFREDLYYRLNVVPIRVPALRERPEDIPLLANHFWRLFSGDATGACPAELLAALIPHSWPGNVRELRNRIERAVVLRRTDEPTGLHGEGPVSYREARDRVIEEFDRSFITALLERTQGNISEAARISSLHRVQLSKLIRQLDLKRPGR